MRFVLERSTVHDMPLFIVLVPVIGGVPLFFCWIPSLILHITTIRLVCPDDHCSSPNPWVLAEVQLALLKPHEGSHTPRSAMEADHGDSSADTNKTTAATGGDSGGRCGTAAPGYFPAKAQEELVVVRVSLPTADEREQVCSLSTVYEAHREIALFGNFCVTSGIGVDQHAPARRNLGDRQLQ